MSQNLNWTREELILALDLYFRVPYSQVTQHHPDIIELSHFLRQLPIYADIPKSSGYRSPSSVSLKLSNFKRLDPAYEGSGLGAGSKLDVEVWNDFSANRQLLQSVAQGIRAAYRTTDYKAPAVIIAIEPEAEFPEGRILTGVHIQRERNQTLVEKKKKWVQEKYGVLACEVCGFDFEKVYGGIGKGFAECHHLIPLSQLMNVTTTKLSDLAILCANCHRMVHRARPPLSVEALRELVHQRRKE
jgi:5-methylcytosine-specific restriction enzyme A